MQLFRVIFSFFHQKNCNFAVIQYVKDQFYTHIKSVKSVCSSRSTRASQSLLMVEKQPKSTPDMLNPPHPIARRGYITYPHGHSLLLSRPLANFAKIQSSRKQR